MTFLALQSMDTSVGLHISKKFQKYLAPSEYGSFSYGGARAILASRMGESNRA